jgi:hypothetical protein
MKNKRITKTDIKNSLFYQLPKFLFLDSKYKEMSNDSKVLYSIYMDRAKLSIKNNWIDSENNVYIKFKNKKIMEILNIASEKLAKLKKELHKFNLIDEIFQGVNKPNIIYVLISNDNNLDINEFDDIDVVSAENSGNSKIEQRAFENRTKGIRKSNTNYTNFNNTDNSNTDKQQQQPENILENKEEEKSVVVVESLIVKFNKKYGGNLDPNLLKNLIKIKGIDIIDKCIDEFKNYIINANQVEKVFYDFCMKHGTDKAYKKNTSYKSNIVNNQPIQSTNYEQREYDDDYWDKFIKNADTAL